MQILFLYRSGGIGVTRLIRARELAKQQQSFIGAQKVAVNQSYL
jgi:hypothetical protein